MNASQTCEILISDLKMSNLNYSLCESPFGVNIEVKKSFIKEKDGTVRSSGIIHDTKILLNENQTLSMALAKQCYDHQNLLKLNWESRMELERVKAEVFEIMSAKDATEEELGKKEIEMIELKNILKKFETEDTKVDPETRKLKLEHKELFIEV